MNHTEPLRPATDAPAAAPAPTQPAASAAQRRTQRPQRAKGLPWLQAVALHHIQRYPCTSVRLRQVLTRRVRRAQQREQPLEEALLNDLDGAIQGIIERFQQLGYLDDQAYAQAVAESLHRQGHSQRGVREKLRQRGVHAEQIDEALSPVEGAPQRSELAAALSYARRRRLGPYRSEGRAERRQKDLAALARRGFDYATASRVIDCAELEPLEAECAEV